MYIIFDMYAYNHTHIYKHTHLAEKYSALFSTDQEVGWTCCHVIAERDAT